MNEAVLPSAPNSEQVPRRDRNEDDNQLETSNRQSQYPQHDKEKEIEGQGEEGDGNHSGGSVTENLCQQPCRRSTNLGLQPIMETSVLDDVPIQATPDMCLKSTDKQNFPTIVSGQNMESVDAPTASNPGIDAVDASSFTPWIQRQSSSFMQDASRPISPQMSSTSGLDSILRPVSTSFYASNVMLAGTDRARSVSHFGLPLPPVSRSRANSRQDKSMVFSSSASSNLVVPAAGPAEDIKTREGGGSGAAGEGAEKKPLRHRLLQGLSRGTEDGDMSDWMQCWSICVRLAQKACASCGPLSRRMYADAVRPWARKFSDADDTGLAGDGGGKEGLEEEGRYAGDDSQNVSVEEVRSQYVLGQLSSLGLGEGERKEESALKLKEMGVIRKEDFLMKLAMSLLSYGCPIPRIEYNMQVLLQTMGMEGSFTVLPNLMFITFGSPISSNTETHILPVGGGLDVYKLRRVNHLVNQILEVRIPSLLHAIKKLDSLIAEPPLYSWQVKLACYTIASGCVAPLFFSGSLIDGLLAGFLGFFAGCLWVLADVSYIVGKVGLVASAWLSSFCATILTSHIPNLCPLAIHFGPVVYLLPGWSITCAVIELSTQNMLSGTIRMMTALMNALLLGFGLDLGHRMAFWENTSSWVSTEHCQPVSAWAKIPLFLSTITCFNILMKGAPAQWLGMLCVAAISFLTINLAPTLHNMSSSSSTVLAAFFVGVAGNLYAYATNSPALIPILSGIFLIVPGGMSVKGVKAWINNDLNGGLAFGSGIVMIAVSISIGLFASSVLMYKPRMKISNAVFF